MVVAETGKQVVMTVTVEAPSSGAGAIERPLGASLTLLSAFELTWDGDPVFLPMPAQRLLAFVALRDRPVLRTYAAETLWLDSSETHACGSLRSALWRLRRPGYELVDVTSGGLRLESRVAVDVRALAAWARRVLDAPREVAGELPGVSGLGDAVFGDLLPDWYDDWLVVERERLRELRARALQRVCERLTDGGSFGPAIEAGLAAIRSEPLRESAHRCLIGVYLAEGNQAEALSGYRRYERLLDDQLGLAPSVRMEELVGGLLGR
jgi:DNA-binding SARP family transcriptional activator